MREARFTLWVVWGTLLASLAIYAGVPLLVTPSGDGLGRFAELLTLCLGLVASGTAIASFVLKRVLVLGPIARQAIDPRTPAGAQRVQTGYLLIWVLAESIGIYGLVLYFLTHALAPMLPFLAGSALLLVLHAPRAADTQLPTGSPDLGQRPDPIG